MQSGFREKLSCSATSAFTRTSSRSRTLLLCLPTRPTSRFPLRLLNRPCSLAGHRPLAVQIGAHELALMQPPLHRLASPSLLHRRCRARRRCPACFHLRLLAPVPRRVTMLSPQHPPHPQQRSEIFS